MSPEGRSSAWKMWLGCPAPLVQINEEGVLVRQREADLRHFRHGLWCDPLTPTTPRPWRTDWHPERSPCGQLLRHRCCQARHADKAICSGRQISTGTTQLPRYVV